MGGAIKITRTDMSAKDLRRAAKRTKDGRVVRRLLAIALVLDGVDRESLPPLTYAKVGGL